VARASRLARAIPWPICVVTAVAAALRFAHVEAVGPNLFYDAAVKSMSMSLHNFFFGAFDPSGVLAVDKPPLDLWLQVMSVKLFGWGQFSLRLPETLAGTLAVPLLYDAVRRAVSKPAGLAAAVALAVLPESVLTSRSDTMDSVMMLLVIAALWLTIRGSQSSGRRAIVLAGVALGLAFNVKLLEALIAAPALAVLYLLASPAPRRRRLAVLTSGAVAMVGVGLAWPLLVTIAPGKHPWPVGSTDGSVWNAMFVFNGFGRVSGGPPGTKPGGPGPFRLLVSTGWHYDVLFGCVLAAAIVVGVAAAVWAWRASRPGSGTPRRPLSAAFLTSLAVWIGLALFVFDVMTKVHARYLEAFAPAVAAAVGCGAAALAGLGAPRGADEERRQPAIALAVLAIVLVAAYTFSFTPRAIGWGVVSLAIAAAGAGMIARVAGPLGEAGKWLLAALIVTAAALFPVHETLSLVRTNANDSGGLATASAANVAALSKFLEPRTSGIRYELAVDEPTALAPLVISDHRAILPLNSFGSVRLTTVAELLRAVRADQVRYALVGTQRCGGNNPEPAACAPPALWIRSHGVDVSAAAGLQGRSRLFLLSANSAS
jgi:4-amino-4-deoxy-L-arabinose transferase-like glycosyltransferase